MKVFLKVFPIGGVSKSSQDMEMELSEDATVKELLDLAQQKLGARLPQADAIMLIHNGMAVDILHNSDRDLKSGDWLWLMPALSQG
jgi:hypothetical protein